VECARKRVLKSVLYVTIPSADVSPDQRRLGSRPPRTPERLGPANGQLGASRAGAGAAAARTSSTNLGIASSVRATAAPPRAPRPDRLVHSRALTLKPPEFVGGTAARRGQPLRNDAQGSSRNNLAFRRRCIPARGVARRSHTPGVLAPCALRAGRLDAGTRSGYFAPSPQGLLRNNSRSCGRADGRASGLRPRALGRNSSAMAWSSAPGAPGIALPLQSQCRRARSCASCFCAAPQHRLVASDHA